MVVGGGSDIAGAALRQVLNRGRYPIASVMLVDVDPDALEAQRQLLDRFDVAVDTLVADLADAADLQRITDLIDEGPAATGSWDLVIVALGVLGGRTPMLDRPVAVDAVMRVNATAAIACAVASGRAMAAAHHGHLVVMSSTAQLRARRSNFVYAASKGAVDIALEGLRGALHGTDITVTVVRPGYVHSKMTATIDVAPLAISADRAGRDIARGIESRRRVVWTPSVIAGVGVVIRAMPGWLWRRVEPRLGRPRS